MEALWNLEDKWKVSKNRAITLLVCASCLVVGLCIVGVTRIIRSSRKGSVHQEPRTDASTDTECVESPQSRCGSMTRTIFMTCHHQVARVGTSTTMTWVEPPRCRWGSVMKTVLMSSVRWSGPSKWVEGLNGSQRERPRPLLVKGDVVGWQSHNSTSPVWQRPILMGEKCELPRFSGVILYDERGMPVHQYEEEIGHAVATTTLRDLL